MRRLTQQEIDKAPDWATHYFIGARSEKVIFINKSSKHYKYQGAVVTRSISDGDNDLFIRKSKPILSKPIKLTVSDLS